jgi:hypothetical protein
MRSFFEPRTGVPVIQLRLPSVIEARPDIAELDPEPIIVTPTGAHVVDPRVRVGRER